jgi:hypothetical protein
MTRLRFSPTVFMLAYCAVYMAALATDLPAFRYYPLEGHLNWGPGVVEDMGPAMAWYGIMANAVVAGALCAVILPDRWFATPLRRFLWLAPLVAVLACVYLMRRFFA